MSHPSNQRRNGYHQAVDQISNLPDPVLCHILSLVPTKSATKTSILSKRWRYMWTKVPVLDFTEMPRSIRLSWQQKICFKSFVDRVLVHNNVSYVQRLYFNMFLLQGDDDFHLKSWLNVLTRREFHEIYIKIICLNPQLKPSLPATFLSSEKLVILKLFVIAINVPLSLHLPKLEIVHLIHLQLPNDDLMVMLSSGCPVLKELSISECTGIASMLYVESRSLKILEIQYTMSNTQQASVFIKAPNIRYLCFQDALRHPIIDDFSSIIEADLNIKCFGDVECGLELVRKVSGVKTLRLGRVGVTCHDLERKLPVFENLTCLRFVSDENTYMLLECAPKLKSLTFENVQLVDYPFESRPVPKCLSCLEHVEFQWFEDIEVVITLVAYLLKAASVLKKLKLSMRSVSTECQREVYERLLMLPRSSAACQVEVVHANMERLKKHRF